MLPNFFFVPSELNIVGMTSDLEGWILSMLAKNSKMIFEFGTCSGKTTYLLALNSGQEAKIYTLTLEHNENIEYLKNESKVAHKNIKKESIYKNFIFSNTEEEKKINVIFCNSLNFDIQNYKSKFDLIFIDGGHTRSILKNDTEKAFQMIAKGGFIFWHDYVAGKKSSKDVFNYLNEISKEKNLYNIKNTSLVYYKHI